MLRQWSTAPDVAPALALRARIVLACADGDTNARAARRLKVSRETVRKWRDRFAAHRLAGLTDEPRSGAPRTIGDDIVRRVVTATLDLPAPTGGRWTTRSLAASVGVSQTAVSRIWREFGLCPDRVRTWRLVADPEFVARVRGVAGVHLAHRGSALALAVGHADAPTPVPRGGGKAPPAVVSVAEGPDWAGDLLGFLTEVSATVPSGALHVLCADESVLGAGPVRCWLARRRRFRCHATPECAPWTVLADRWLVRSGDVGAPGAADLRERVRGWGRESGQHPSDVDYFRRLRTPDR
ncbi:helix-turn-helix domain-containing protein [Micromonospora rubida]|uniref:helix-turn-helix domain-containing protein n=1 Tax=Micromonospora rubida TaxID=2697657 RepID=UPI00137896B5|nr:helix-turn-helix domain-containing protein [Micromonospora rubida]NBE80065.1 helix-turn-helix domain-containing protein [Micromonospora rubida]